jgi:quercetin dioxygenase-like cupin family protein
MTVTVVAKDGSVIASLMADLDDPELRKNFPDADFVATPRGVHPNKSWRYVDGKFVPPDNYVVSAAVDPSQMLHAMPFQYTLPDGKSQQSVAYTFMSVGSKIPMHEHDFWHTCQVLRGSVTVSYGDGKQLQVRAGGIVILNANEQHEIVAREVGTMTIHTNEPGR